MCYTKHQAFLCCMYIRTCHTHYHKAFLCCMHQAPSYPVLYVPTYVPHPLSQSFPVVCTKHQAILCCTYLCTCHTHYYKAFLCCMHQAPVLYVPTYVPHPLSQSFPVVCTKHQAIQCCTYLRTCHTHYYKAFLCCMHQAPVLYVPTYVPHPLSQSFPVVCTKHQAILCCTYLHTCHTHSYKAFLCCMHQAPVLYVPTYVPHPLLQSFPVLYAPSTKLSCVVRTCHAHSYKAFLYCTYVHTYIHVRATPTVTKLSCVVCTYMPHPLSHTCVQTPVIDVATA